MATATRPDERSPNPWTHMVESASSFKLCSDFRTGIVACVHACVCVRMCECVRVASEARQLLPSPPSGKDVKTGQTAFHSVC